MENNIYREYILEHYKHPLNKGVLPDATFSYKENNPLCGDEIEFFVRVDPTGQIEKATFEGKGCAISQAAGSILTEYVKGKHVKEVVHLSASDIENILGVSLSTVRIKCALLPHQAMVQGWNKYNL